MSRGRKPGFFYEYILNDVLIFVSNSPGASINEVATKCGIGWSTAKNYLAKLEAEGKIIHRELGKNRKVYQSLGESKEELK